MKEVPTVNDLARPVPKPTAQVAVYYEVLGLDLTVDFLLAFGGAELNIPDNPQGRSQLEKLIGADKTRALARELHRLQRRVPLAAKWLASVMAWQGHSTAEIARRLRTTDSTVRRWLKRAAG
jgi:Sigma-70, region 4